MKKPLIPGFVILILIVMILPNHSLPAHGARVANDEFIHVVAKIDGSDWFEMTGNAWRWQHGVFEAPETHLNNASDGVFATLVNGQSFLSTWPDGISYGAYSEENIVAELSSLEELYGSDVRIRLEIIQARGVVTLTQEPDLANVYTFKVFLNDAGHIGSALYEFKIWALNTGNLNTGNPIFENQDAENSLPIFSILVGLALFLGLPALVALAIYQRKSKKSTSGFSSPPIPLSASEPLTPSRLESRTCTSCGSNS